MGLESKEQKSNFLKEGALVRVLRTSGKMDPDWTIHRIETYKGTIPPKRIAWVRKLENGQTLEKNVDLELLEKWNSDLKELEEMVR